MIIHTESLPHPDHFRLMITETDFWYREAFERFLQNYDVFPNEEGV